MTPITAAAVVAVLETSFPNVTEALIQPFVDPLNAAMERFSIVTPERQAAFVPQIAHESEGFTHLVEDLTYTHAEHIYEMFRSHFASVEEAAKYVRNPEALANRVYASRLGNGDESTGDGFKFRGRGLLQTTGRANYQQAGLALYGSATRFIAGPGELARPTDAALSAALFWERHGCNELADEGDFRAITKAINGGYNGYNQRVSLWDTAKTVLV